MKKQTWQQRQQQVQLTLQTMCAVVDEQESKKCYFPMYI